MADENSLVVEIVLEGAEAIQAGLAKVGKVGEDAFKGIANAGQSIAAAFAGGGDISSKLTSIGSAAEGALASIAKFSSGSPFGKVAIEIGAVVAGTSALVGGLTAWVTSTASAVVEMDHLATLTGTTIEKLSGMKSVLGSLGANTDNLEQSFRRMAVRIETEWPLIVKAIEEGSDKARSNQIKIIESANAISEAYHKTAEAARQASLTMITNDLAVSAAHRALATAAEEAFSLQAKNITSIKGAVQGLEQAELNLRKARGEEVSSADEERLKIDQAELAVETARQALADAELKQKQELAAAADKQTQLELALQQAEAKAAEDRHKAAQEDITNRLAQEKATLDLAAAQRQAADDALKDIGQISAAIKTISAGGIAAGFDLSKVAADDLTKGIINAASALNGGLKPTEEQVLQTMAASFHNITDETSKMAIATQLLGRSVGVDTVAALTRGTVALETYRAKNKELGLEITGPMKDAFASELLAFRRLSSVVNTTAQQIASAFAPSITAGLTLLDEAMRNNHQRFLAFGELIANTLSPLIEDFFRILAGAQVQLPWLALIVDGLTLVKDGIVLVVNLIASAFDGLATIINSVFGTSITSGQLFIVALAAIVAAFFPVLAAVLAVAAAFGFLVQRWNESVETVKGWRDALVANFDSVAERWDGFIKTITEFDFVQFFVDLATAFADWAAKSIPGVQLVIDAWQKLKELWNSMSSGPPAAAVAPGGGEPPPGAATGGLLSGPRSGFLAMLHGSEFVVQESAWKKLGLSAMNQINRGLLPGFARGGHVGGQLAGGGGTNNVLNLVIDGNAFNGLNAPANTFEALSKYATLRQMTSTGRKATRQR